MAPTDPRLDDVITELRLIRADYARTAEHIVKNTADLEYHIQRTNMLEDMVKEHASLVQSAKTVFKILAWVIAVVGGSHAGISLIKL